MRVAVVIYNLGGPDRQESVRPFLFNLFRDPAIIRVSQPARMIIAGLIAGLRAGKARGIYRLIGGSSPILKETEAQARALEASLREALPAASAVKTFVAMRYWHPLAHETAAEVKAFHPERVILLPLYPQFSTTTTGSFRSAWDRAQAKAGLGVPTVSVCCYPAAPDFIAAHAELIREAIRKAGPLERPRLLFSAHGLPERIVADGDPYAFQVEVTAKAIVAALTQDGTEPPDWGICYQSRVGPLAWLGPSTDEAIRAAGSEGRDIVLVPISFVSEHVETLVELDIDYRDLAARMGVGRFVRVPALGTAPAFIEALTKLVLRATERAGTISADGTRLCPLSYARCPHEMLTEGDDDGRLAGPGVSVA